MVFRVGVAGRTQARRGGERKTPASPAAEARAGDILPHKKGMPLQVGENCLINVCYSVQESIDFRIRISSDAKPWKIASVLHWMYYPLG
jgi:hypothetical protein